LSSTFGGGRDGASGAPTPNSTGGGGGRSGTSKKGKKITAAAEDSETDGRETKKVRTSFGARK
jgi:chromatin modification-related protein EAF6